MPQTKKSAFSGLPADLLSDAFPVSQKANIGVNPEQLPITASGRYLGRPFSWDSYRRGATKEEATDPNPYIVLRSRHDDSTKMHELGHSMWWNDIPAYYKKAWQSIHQGHVNRMTQSKGLDSRILTLFYNYADDPGHSWAEAFALYSTAPAALQAVAPDVYRFMQEITKVEYTRKPWR